MGDVNRKVFNVLYTKSSVKKRKVYQDGYLILFRRTGINTTVSLVDSTNHELTKKAIQENECSKYCENIQTVLGAYDIQIEKENCESITISETKFDNPINNITSVPPYKIARTLPTSRTVETAKQSENFLSSICITKSEKLTVTDSALLRAMRRHQIDGANIILERITKPFSVTGDDTLGSGEYMGCILADEMGLGKTLTTIAAVYTYIKISKSKAVVVCPSSLVNNWAAEVYI